MKILAAIALAALLASCTPTPVTNTVTRPVQDDYIAGLSADEYCPNVDRPLIRDMSSGAYLQRVGRRVAPRCPRRR